ncbi:hypothetical protein AB4259_02720 [Vibrio amylolyticus]|uniref:hypothetical protein n=1 Tax=Vibrio amylolyticus TaxID=2847292 RepID=UPI003550BBED
MNTQNKAVRVEELTEGEITMTAQGTGTYEWFYQLPNIVQRSEVVDPDTGEYPVITERPTGDTTQAITTDVTDNKVYFCRITPTSGEAYDSFPVRLNYGFGA